MPHLELVAAVARRLFAGGSEAEDAVQDTFLRAYRTFDNYTAGTNARAWLLTILYSVVANRMRRRRLEPEARDHDTLDALAQAELLARDWETPLIESASRGALGADREIEVALRRLPEEARQVVVLVDLGDLTYEEAASAMDCPVGTVRSRLSRARRMLGALLADYARDRGYAGGRR